MRRLYDWLERTDTNIGKITHASIAALILLNTALVALDSHGDVPASLHPLVATIETASVAIFTAEFLLRLLASPYAEGDACRWSLVLRHAVSPLTLIDLLAILPFYLPLFLPLELRMLRMARVFRLLHVMRLDGARQSSRS